MTVLLEARGIVAVRMKQPVLAVDDFRVSGNEYLSLVGPNGSGKTTLILALLKLLPVQRGNILYKGVDIATIKPAHRYRRNFAAVFQDAQLLNTTVYRNVAEGLRIRGADKKETGMLVMKNLERFGIAALAGRNARRISSGEAQRVALARAFALNPEILFLDEPFSSLDAPSKETIIRDFERALSDTPTAVIMATHDMNEALRLSHTITVMNCGRILQSGPPELLARQPSDEFVASFFGNETILTGAVAQVFDGSFVVSVNGRSIEVAGEAQPGAAVTFCVRPENIVLSREPAGKTSARNSFTGKVTKIIPAGFYYKIHVDCGFELVSYITNHSMEIMGLAAGQEICTAFKSTAVHVLRVGAAGRI